MRSARQGAMPAPHSTPRKDSPSAALLVEQLGDAPPTSALPARQRGIEVRSSRSTQGQKAPFNQRLKSRRHRRIALPLSGWQELRHDFSPIGDQDALPQTHPAKVLAQLVLEITDADGFHTSIVATRGYIVNEIPDRAPAKPCQLVERGHAPFRTSGYGTPSIVAAAHALLGGAAFNTGEWEQAEKELQRELGVSRLTCSFDSR